MLTDDELNLITAGVDGDLSGAEAQSLRLLLDDSGEARATYEQLRADSIRVQILPRIQPPSDLQARVMARIAALRTPSATEPAHRSEPVHHKWPRWAPVGIAASLLIGIAGASFLFFSGDRGDPSVARNQNRPPPATRDGAADPRWADWLPAATARLPSAADAVRTSH